MVAHLIESNTRSYLHHMLHKCHDHRVRTYSWAFNALVLVAILLVGGCTLYFCRKRKLTPYEQKQKAQKDQEYVLSKIWQYQDRRFTENQLPKL